MSNPKLLLVEDDAGLRAILKEKLERIGWSVTESPNGMDALGVLGVIGFEVISTDFQMPEMNGLAFTKTVMDQDPEQRIVMLSGSPIAKQNFLNFGGQHFMDKDDLKYYFTYMTEFLNFLTPIKKESL